MALDFRGLPFLLPDNVSLIEACVNSQTFGDGQHNLPMSDGRADIFGNMQRSQQRPLLVAGGASAALLAGEGDEHLLTRNYFFCRDLMESRVDFVCCDQPHVDPFTIHILAAVAEQERKLISERTRYSNQIRRERGGLLGAHHPRTPSIDAEASKKGRLVSAARNRSATRSAYADLLPAMLDLRHRQNRSYQQVCDELNAAGQVTRCGKRWNKTQARRVLVRHQTTGMPVAAIA